MKAARVTTSSSGYWNQISMIPQDAQTGAYTLSAHFSQFEDSPTSGTSNFLLFMDFWQIDVDYNLEQVGSLVSTTLPITWASANQYSWKRVSVSIPNIPIGTIYVRVGFYTTGGTPGSVIVDGVQLVPYSRPAQYEPETSAMEHMSNLYIHLDNSLREWHNVGDLNEPIFNWYWVNYDTTNFNAAGFMIDEFGIVHLRGLISTGTIGQPAFTLPEGYRPLRHCIFPGISIGAFAAIRVEPNGTVRVVSGNNAWVSLEGITFSIYY
jgi:hypothetical protein